MDRLTRKELKSDKFAQEVGQTVDFLTEHRQQLIRYGSVAVVVALLIVGTYFYRQRQHRIREAALAAAIELQEANIGQPANAFAPAFQTQEEKDKAVLKAFTDLAAKYPGTDEGAIAEYFLGVISADKGKMEDAQKHFQAAIDTASAGYASQAKLALAQIYKDEGKTAEGEKLLKSIIDHPTSLVSKDQATIALALLIAPTRPNDAEKLLEPLRTERSAISRASVNALAQIAQERQQQQQK